MIYKIWIGNRAEVPFIMTLLVGIYVLLHSWDALQVNMINGVGTIKLQTNITLIGLVAHIPLSILFAQFAGALGVVMSMSCITLFYSIVFTIQIRKLLNQKATGIWAA